MLLSLHENFLKPVARRQFLSGFCIVYKEKFHLPDKISAIATGVILVSFCEDPPPKNTFVEQIQIENSFQSKEHQKLNVLTSFNFSYQFIR